MSSIPDGIVNILCTVLTDFQKLSNQGQFLISTKKWKWSQIDDN